MTRAFKTSEPFESLRQSNTMKNQSVVVDGQTFDVMANFRKAKLERIFPLEWKGKSGITIPTRSLFRAEFTNKHDKGKIAFVADTVKEARTKARIAGIALRVQLAV